MHTCNKSVTGCGWLPAPNITIQYHSSCNSLSDKQVLTELCSWSTTQRDPTNYPKNVIEKKSIFYSDNQKLNLQILQELEIKDTYLVFSCIELYHKHNKT